MVRVHLLDLGNQSGDSSASAAPCWPAVVSVFSVLVTFHVVQHTKEHLTSLTVLTNQQKTKFDYVETDR